MGKNFKDHVESQDWLKEIIDSAKEKTESELERKIEKLKRGSMEDVFDLLTDGDIVKILTNIDSFQGSIADFSKVQRFKKIAQSAQWLDANSLEVVGCIIGQISSNQPNAIVSLDIRRLSNFRAAQLSALTAMFALADNVFFSGIKDSVIRISYGIEGVYSE